MTLAALLFLSGCLFGLHYRAGAIAILSILFTSLFLGGTALAGSLSGATLLAWFGYLAAAQAGYAAGSFHASWQAEPAPGGDPVRKS